MGARSARHGGCHLPRHAGSLGTQLAARVPVGGGLDITEGHPTAHCSYTLVINILVLCTANLCRSPIAAELLGRRLAERGIVAEVTSAGRGPSGLSPPPDAVASVDGLEIDLSAHRSSTATAGHVQRAELVLGVAREHVRDSFMLDPAAWPRAFTLKEFVRRGEAAGPAGPGESFDLWLTRVRPYRSATDVLGASSDDDVADPIGCSRRVYRRIARELDALTERVAGLLDRCDHG